MELTFPCRVMKLIAVVIAAKCLKCLKSLKSFKHLKLQCIYFENESWNSIMADPKLDEFLKLVDVLEHIYILTQNNPDSGYEYFWLNFKSSVSNVVHRSASACSMALRKLENRVPAITKQLDLWKTSAQFKKIGDEIQEFLLEFLWYILSTDEYQQSIAMTNLRRWIKCCELRVKCPAEGFIPLIPLDNPDMLLLYFLHRCMGCGGDQTIQTYVNDAKIGSRTERQDILIPLLVFTVHAHKNGIMDKFLEYYPDWTISQINERYKTKLPKGIKSGAKALRSASASANSFLYNNI
jgi:hypothetical protein